MKRRATSDTAYLIMFFAAMIAAGTIALSLPFASSGERAVSPVDALFTATSAVCVTGLATVGMSEFSGFGQTVILILIQLGGLGIISVTSILLSLPGHRLPFRRLKTVRSFFIGGVEYNPMKIVRSIIAFTLAIETLGAVALSFFLRADNPAELAFVSAFHSISAFCNAGFSTYPDSLVSFAESPAVLAVVSCLIVSGGIGFIVLQDIGRRVTGKSKRLSYHSKLVLSASAILVLAGAAAIYLLERDASFAALSPGAKAMNSLFQAVTPRTAGFNAVPQTALSQSSKFLTMILMFVGGAPGSIAGGIKVTTAFVVLLVMVRRTNDRGDINSFRRRLSPETTRTAVVYFLKAGFLLVAASVALSLTEGGRGASFGDIVFETFSAFGTVGLSLDFTPTLTFAGKLVIIATMFAGRVGLIALTLTTPDWKYRHAVYPEAEILLG